MTACYAWQPRPVPLARPCTRPGLSAYSQPLVDSQPSLHLLDHGLEVLGHRRNRLAPELHPTARRLLHHEVERSELGALFGIVVAEVTATALFSLEGRACDRFGHRE